MAITANGLINDDRFCGENVIQFFLYLPFGVVLLALRTVLALILWIASILLPNSQSVRQLLSTFACWTFGVYVKVKGCKDSKCCVLVANCVSCLDSLAVSHALGSISLKKWKVPPFFASTLGIKNVSQFNRKQHFADSSTKPLLLQPEGGATNGNGVLKFTDWAFQIGNRVQPIAITVKRPFTNVTVHRPSDSRDKFPWSDALWFLWTPVTVFNVTILPTLERHDDDDSAFSQRIRACIAQELKVEVTEYRWEELNRAGLELRRGPGGPGGLGGLVGPGGLGALGGPGGLGALGGPGGLGGSGGELVRLARRVQVVLPAVPLADIMRDLANTRSVDVTITNFLEGVTPYRPLDTSTPSTSSMPSPSSSAASEAPATFPSSARARQRSFQERKAQMIAEARAKYIEKHGLSIAQIS